MIYNENGVIMEFVTINNQKFVFPNTNSLLESKDDNNKILQELDKVKDILKECDDKKLKKMQAKAKGAFLAKKIHSATKTLQYICGGLGAFTVFPALASTKLLIVMGALFALCIVFKGLSKLPEFANKNKINSINKSLEEAKQIFKMISENDQMPENIRKSANEKMSKLTLAIENISNQKVSQYYEDNYKSCDLKIKGVNVRVNRDHYELNKDDYAAVVKLIESKWNKILDKCADLISDDNEYDINSKYIEIDSECQSKIKCEQDKSYKCDLSLLYDYEEVTLPIYCDLFINVENNQIEIQVDTDSVSERVAL